VAAVALLTRLGGAERDTGVGVPLPGSPDGTWRPKPKGILKVQAVSMSGSLSKACVSINLPENEISLERTQSATVIAEAGLASEATPQRRSVEEVPHEADAGALKVSAPQEEVLIGTRLGEER
jgi:hypothetical protein